MKKLTAILLSILLVFSLAACGNNQQATDTTPEPSSEPVSETTSEPEKRSSLLKRPLPASQKTRIILLIRMWKVRAEKR